MEVIRNHWEVIRNYSYQYVVKKDEEKVLLANQVVKAATKAGCLEKKQTQLEQQ